MNYHDRPTYRYAVVIGGANYALGSPDNPDHVFMCQSLEDVKIALEHAKYAGNPYRETGKGEPTPFTPGYGHPGDSAEIHRIEREREDFGEVLDEPGDRARHAFYFISQEPVKVAVFGPRGGITLHDWIY